MGTGTGTFIARQKKKKKKGVEFAHDQYLQLRERLATTHDVREKNIIFRRLKNLLDVMTFLNGQQTA